MSATGASLRQSAARDTNQTTSFRHCGPWISSKDGKAFRLLGACEANLHHLVAEQRRRSAEKAQARLAEIEECV